MLALIIKHSEQIKLGRTLFVLFFLHFMARQRAADWNIDWTNAAEPSTLYSPALKGQCHEKVFLNLYFFASRKGHKVTSFFKNIYLGSLALFRVLIVDIKQIPDFCHVDKIQIKVIEFQTGIYH